MKNQFYFLALLIIGIFFFTGCTAYSKEDSTTQIPAQQNDSLQINPQKTSPNRDSLEIQVNRYVFRQVKGYEMNKLYNNYISKYALADLLPYFRKLALVPDSYRVRFMIHGVFQLRFSEANQQERKDIVDIFLLELDKERQEENLYQGAFKFLTEYAVAADFDADAKNKILEVIQASEYPLNNFVLLAGVAGVKEIKPQLEKKIAELDAYNAKSSIMPSRIVSRINSPSGNFKLALARMGYDEYVDYIVNELKSSQSVEDFRLFYKDKLIYLRHPKALEGLKENIFSDKTFASVHAGKKPIPLAYVIIPDMHKIIKNFPTPQKETYQYTEEDLEQVRQWLRNQSRFEIIR